MCFYWSWNEFLKIYAFEILTAHWKHFCKNELLFWKVAFDNFRISVMTAFWNLSFYQIYFRKIQRGNWLLDFVQSWLDFAFVGNYFIQVLVPLRTINRIIFQVSAIWDLTRFFNFDQISKLAFSEKNWLILLLHSQEAFCKCSNPKFGTPTKTFGSLGSNFE